MSRAATDDNGFGCQRCDAFHASVVKLLGEVTARLCVPCVNEWRNVCEGLPAFALVEELDERVNCAYIEATGVRDAWPIVSRLRADQRALTRGPIRTAAERWLLSTRWASPADPGAVGGV